jgi:excinuclease UvrABC ATPase subunit
MVVPDKDKTLHKGAVAPWAKGPSPLYTQTLQALAALRLLDGRALEQAAGEGADVILLRHRRREDQVRL